MKPILLLFSCLLFIAHSGLSQAGKVGINTTTPTAMLHVKDSSVLFSGLNPLPGAGNPPASGPGTRMMWYADKAAIRVGRITGTGWDKDSIGLYSIAGGLNSKASGQASIALGENANANGQPNAR